MHSSKSVVKKVFKQSLGIYDAIISLPWVHIRISILFQSVQAQNQCDIFPSVDCLTTFPFNHKNKTKILFQNVYSQVDMQKQKANGPLHFLNQQVLPKPLFIFLFFLANSKDSKLNISVTNESLKHNLMNQACIILISTFL